jgi:phosphate-selective porin
MKNIFTLLFVSVLFTNQMISQETKEITNDSIQKSLNDIQKTLEVIKRVKINGWIQAQLQFADSSGQQSFDGGNFAVNSDKRFMIRRGRIKFTYQHQTSEYVLQVNLTERGINVADIYAKVTDPWTKWVSIQAGLFNRPFGFEVQQSSADRETPERSRYTQTLLQNERDMGAALMIEAPKKSKFYGLKFTGGFFNGTGIPSNGDYNNPTKPFVNDFDVFKDFIGRLNYGKSLKEDKIKFGVGVSHYNGAIRQFNNTVYSKTEADTTGTLKWIASDSTKVNLKGKGAAKIYYGMDAQLSVKSKIGITTLRVEYMFGQQPGTSSSSVSQAFEPKTATYIRNFKAYSAVFVQRIGKTKHELAVKYSFYDPNTKVAGNDIGKAGSGFNTADLAYTDIGFGYINYFNDNIKFMIYYNLVKNETTKSIGGYSKDLKDNVFTIRMQVRF